ncbi:sideroflexin [Moesziomyces antarcticus T-34]|uniref:Sideroflexin n=1 Tax=Pseudozyma antarctica (strain T-34) TaxID=1151754 RepID=M9MDZ4_PSEA3|nr:sideroflexin [Moesziomyces antarcticus T-34]
MTTSAISPGGAVESTPLLSVARQRYAIHSPSEASTTSEYTPQADLVDITKDRYDLSTFKGRLLHFASVTSPLTLLASNAELKAAQETVASYEAKFPANRTTGTFMVPRSEAERYWKAKQLVDSSVHPDTGEVILLPFRMAAFVPTNLLVVGGMLMPNPSLAGIVFWQWVNQSLNVAVNYSNANKSVPMNMKEVGLAYAAATTSAVGIAVGMSRGVPKLRVSPGVKGVLTSLVPFVSVASAGIVNISCMRWKEIKDGVGVYIRDAEGNRHHVGDSSKAGQRAVAMTAASRLTFTWCGFAVPTLILPPLALKFLQRARVIPASGALTRAVDLTLIGTSLLVFLPPAIATFPQVAKTSPQTLEPKFHHLTDPQANPITQVEFNKGL